MDFSNYYNLQQHKQVDLSKVHTMNRNIYGHDNNSQNRLPNWYCNEKLSPVSTISIRTAKRHHVARSTISTRRHRHIIFNCVPFERMFRTFQKMIRRPITVIELKLDDLQEYDAVKREQANISQEANASLHKPPTWNIGKKSTKEIHERIGLAQQGKRNNLPS